MASHLLAVALVMCLSSTAQAKTDVSSPHHITIAKSSVEQALKTLAQQTGVQLLFPFDLVKTLQAEPLRGDYTVMQALDILLKDTGLSGSLTDSGVITISQIDLNSNGKGKDDMNIKTKKSLLATLIAFFATGAVTQGVMAQDDGQSAKKQQIDEIIVTAQKREQKLIDVPISISAISGEALDDAGIQDITDLSYAVPSFSTVDVGPGLTVFAIRGVGNIRGSSPTIGVYLDDIPASMNTLQSLDLQVVDLKRAEVLKGPQGTLYGQGSMGGTVRYITNDPSFEGVEGRVTLSAFDTHKGSNSERMTGFVNIPLIDETLAFRVSGTYKDESGWIDQPTANLEDINDNDLSNIRIEGLWQALDEFAIRGTAIRHRNDFGALNIVNTTPLEKSNFQRAVFPNEAGARGYSDYDLYNLTLDYDFGSATLTSSSSWVDQSSRIDESQFAEFTFGSLEALSVNLDKTAESFTQDVRLTSNDSSGSSALDWTVGVFYSDLTTTRSNNFWLAINNGAPANLGVARIDFGSKSIAYYADASYSVTDQLTIGLGGRYFKDDKTQLSFSGAELGILREGSFDDFSSRVYFSCAFTDNINTYFNVSEGFRSGGFNTLGAPDYDPEQILAYELGIKSTLLDKRLQANLAVFYSEYDDYLTTNQIVSGTALVTVTANVGEALIEGVEWSLDWVVTDQLSVGFNGAITNAEFTRIDSMSPSPTNIDGDYLPFIPKYGYSFNASYGFEWSDSVLGGFRLSYNREGQNSVTDRGSSFVPSTYVNEPFGFLDAQLSAQFQSVSVELFGQNILDEDKLVGVSVSRETPQARPRSLGIRLSYDF